MLTLKVQPRKLLGRKNQILRKEDIIPAVVYGHGFKPQAIQVPYLVFKKIFQEVGESNLLNLEIEGEKPVKVLIHALQYHPLTDKIQHIDFYKIKAGEKVTVEVELKFIGEAPVVKELSGVLVPNLDKVEIECLPENLIHDIEVDISKLANFDDIIRVGDLKIPVNVKVLQNSNDPVMSIERPRSEEELEKLEEVPEEKPEEVEMAEKKGGEEEAETIEEKKEGAEKKSVGQKSEDKTETKTKKE